MQDAVIPAGQAEHRSGFVALVGRSNVGKSTLLNRLLGHKVAIVTPKPQTTRHRILGILTVPGAQVIFVDTPGLHAARSLLNRRMVETAERTAAEADVLLWVLDAVDGVTAADRELAARLRPERRPVCAALNKIDRLPRAALLPLLAAIEELLPGRDVVPTSGLTGLNLTELEAQIVRLLPPGPRYYGAETFTDQTERTLAQEMVREQILLQTRDEVPYAVAVSVDSFTDKGRVTVIAATIHVERESQKRILVGARGARIKQIGSAARGELQKLLGRRIYLELFVRVQEGWTEQAAMLKEFGL